QNPKTPKPQNPCGEDGRRGSLKRKSDVLLGLFNIVRQCNEHKKGWSTDVGGLGIGSLGKAKRLEK
ncbi:MAG: hypothetical protein P4L69_24100, partial [Desulfosporosinus sp.]|nr:hypothetical protein [Desulfosporosinus sp.]